MVNSERFQVSMLLPADMWRRGKEGFISAHSTGPEGAREAGVEGFRMAR